MTTRAIVLRRDEHGRLEERHYLVEEDVRPNWVRVWLRQNFPEYTRVDLSPNRRGGEDECWDSLVLRLAPSTATPRPGGHDE